MDKSLMPTKKPLTEEDIKWCNEAIAEAEPYDEEEYNKVLSNFPCDSIAILNSDYNPPYPEYKYDIKRTKATIAKEMLEQGWK